MKKFQWTVPAVAFCSLVLAALTVTPLQAQSCDGLIFRVTQGNYEQSSLGFQPMVVQANQEGHVRVYWRSNSPDPYTLSAQYGHPSDFGYQGDSPNKVRQHFRLNLQQPQQEQRGKVTFQAMRPGSTTIGFRITGSNNGSVFPQIPRGCRSGVLTVQVQGAQQNQGSYGNQGSPGYGGGQNDPGYNNSGNLPFIGGRYTTEFGDMVLNQDGQRVWGTYTHQQGQIEGTFDGKMVHGVWKQAPTYRAPNDAGDIQMRFLNGRFSAVWRYGHSPQAKWEGTWAGTFVGR